jgi:AcrR family transcriptional regulator
MRDIVADADAPRGSLQHYFPDGKDQIVSEALLFMGEAAGRRTQRALEKANKRSPSALFAAIVAKWKEELLDEGYVAGCPLVAAAADVVATNSELREVIARAFDKWQDPLAAALVETGIPRRRSEELAVLVITALEGAIILARIRHDTSPLDLVVRQLSPLLDVAASPPALRRLDR